MSDEQNIDAGSETSGEQATDTTASEQSDTTDTTAADTSATDTAQADTSASADAGGVATATEGTSTPDANQSRTGFAEKGLHVGDQCTCPDGRKGTVHSFDAGLICIPNADQG
jgi:hypothetical protein